MIAHLPRMIGQAGAPGFFVGGFESIEKGLQRRFRIDHNVLAAGQLHHQIRTQPSRLRGHRLLLGEIAIREHARDLDHAPQLNFSPAPAHIGSAQRPHQIASLRLQFFLRGDQRLHLGPQFAVSIAARHFHLLNLRVHFIQRIAHRSDQVGHGFLPGFEIAPGLALEALQSFFGNHQKRRVVALQCVGGHGFEGIAQVLRWLRVTNSIFSLLVFRSDSRADSSLALPATSSV